MKWLTRIGIIALALVAVLALAPFFVTLDDYIPVLEKEISTRFEEPVSIDALRASMFPSPRVKVEGIAIGADKELKVGELTVQPHIWSLFSARKVIRRLEFDDVTLSLRSLGALIGLAQRDSGSARIAIESVRLRNAVLKLENTSFGPFDAQVDVESGGKRGVVTLAARDGTFDARITPKDDAYALEISAKAWTPPIGPPIRFNALEVKGTAKGSIAELDSIAAKLYGGTAAGNATVRWDKGISVKGKIELNDVELREAGALASPKARISGKLDAKPAFSASAPKASQLDETLRIETAFTVSNGVLHGVDLANAAALIVKQGATGGETRFDQLSGHLVRQGKAYRFTQLKIASGALAARGHIAIAPSRALSGQLSTSLSAVGAVASLPLVVAGTLDAPLVYPSAGAVLGAAAGTAVLPGVGTAAGVKLGEIVEGLLGKKK